MSTLAWKWYNRISDNHHHIVSSEIAKVESLPRTKFESPHCNYECNIVSWCDKNIHTLVVVQEHGSCLNRHYSVVIMGTVASQMTSSLTSVYSTVYSGENQRKHQSYASLVFVQGIHRWLPRTKASIAGNVFVWWRHNCLEEWVGGVTIFQTINVRPLHAGLIVVMRIPLHEKTFFYLNRELVIFPHQPI